MKVCMRGMNLAEIQMFIPCLLTLESFHCVKFFLLDV